VPVAVGLAMTMPGIPVVWAGDELGFTAADGEQARTPIPWDRLDAFAEPIELYRRMIALRRSHPALTGGGIRWLHASDDAVAFVREAASEAVLVVAARDAAVVELGAELRDDASLLEGAVTWSGGRVATSGPTFLAWRLPGVELPGWSAARRSIQSST
jgi:alpha-glucosidase